MPSGKACFFRLLVFRHRNCKDWQSAQRARASCLHDFEGTLKTKPVDHNNKSAIEIRQSVWGWGLAGEEEEEEGKEKEEGGPHAGFFLGRHVQGQSGPARALLSIFSDETQSGRGGGDGKRRRKG